MQSCQHQIPYQPSQQIFSADVATGIVVRLPPPNSLREQAVGLLEHYSSSKITSELRISGGQLK